MKTLFLFLLFSAQVNAAEMSGVKLDDKTSVNGQELVLNGIGLRKVTRFGFPIKVYVGGLYVPKKSKDSDEIIKMKGAKKIVMQFLLPVDRDNLVETFDNSFRGNCIAECDKRADQFSQIKVHIAAMRKGDQMIFTILEDKALFEIKGANAKSVELKGATISTNILAMFINKNHPPSPELRKSFLGE